MLADITGPPWSGGRVQMPVGLRHIRPESVPFFWYDRLFRFLLIFFFLRGGGSKWYNFISPVVLKVALLLAGCDAGRYNGTSVVGRPGSDAGRGICPFSLRSSCKDWKKNLFIVCVRKQNICSKFPALPPKKIERDLRAWVSGFRGRSGDLFLIIFSVL